MKFSQIVRKSLNRILSLTLALLIIIGSQVTVSNAELAGSIQDKPKVIISPGFNQMIVQKSDQTLWYIYGGPALYEGISNVKAISYGYNHALFLTQEGYVYASGSNNAGQIGDGTTTNRGLTRVTGIPIAKDIRAGYETSFVVGEDGSFWAWGRNKNYELGMYSPLYPYSPVQVTALTGADKIFSISGQNNIVNAYVLMEDGTVFGWGKTLSPTKKSSVVPTHLPDFAGAVSIKAGKDTHLALMPNGKLKGAGASTALIDINIVAIDTGRGEHNLAIDVEGNVWAWGLNTNGQCGDGTTTTVPAAAPVKVQGLPDDVDILAVYTTSNASFALASDGMLWGWGISTMLGHPNPAFNQYTPVEVIRLWEDGEEPNIDLPSNIIVEIAEGEQFDLSLTETSATGKSFAASWSSSDNSVATVDKDGKVTGISEGETTITSITANGLRKNITVMVSNYDLDDIQIDINMKVDSKLKLNATDEDGQIANVHNWRSSETLIATIDSNGVVTAIKPGTTTISAYYDGEVISTITIRVV